MNNKESVVNTDVRVRMPWYTCHKKVQAVKIYAIDLIHSNAMITPQDCSVDPFLVDRAYLSKHQPEIGGYYVLYEDGYESYSPAKAFESGYTKL